MHAPREPETGAPTARRGARLRRALPHLALSAVVFALNAPGLGYRAIWQDEAETAERARTILESGYPRVIDASGEPSLNFAGEEIEEGAAHRYSPWAQFYAGALGLALARPLGLEEDAAVRLPFAAAHAAAGGLASWGLSAYASVALPWSLLAGAALSVQTVRTVHNRTARYHALLDLLAVLGALALGATRAGRRWGPPAIAATLFLLPHVHTLGGCVVAVGLGIWALDALLAPERGGGLRERLWRCVGYAVAPGAASLALLVWLVRPASHAHLLPASATTPSRWAMLLELWSLKDGAAIAYAGVAVGAGVIALAVARRRRAAAVLAAGAAAMAAAIHVLDLYPTSQPRYYLAAPLLVLLWPVALGLDALGARARAAVAAATIAVALLPDLVLASLPGAQFPPFQGLRIAIDDVRKAREGARQPLREVVRIIRARGAPGDPVVFEYVPQFANWYLPEHPVALAPDAKARTPLNRDNPVWERPPRFPRWHVWYAGWPDGFFSCSGACDFRAEDVDLARGRYTLRSGRLGRAERMCVVAAWTTHQWNNAPFALYAPASLTPAGPAGNTLVLGTPCDAGAAR